MLASRSPRVGSPVLEGGVPSRVSSTTWALDRLHFARPRKHTLELAAGADAELGEDLAQVVLDGARADEQPRADLRVGEAVARQPGDLRLLRGELVARLGGARLRAVSPVASSSRAARSANASAPIAANISCAARSCSRASTRRSLAAQPLAVERDGRGRARRASRCGRAARSPPVEPLGRLASLSSARERASTPSAQSVPLARVVSASRSSASAASSGAPLRAAASTSSTSDPGDEAEVVGARTRARAAASASS